MQRIINGKKYDTDTAQILHQASASCPCGDFQFWEEALYRKTTGEYFLAGSGGPMTHYARHLGDNTQGHGEGIRPVNEAEARHWTERHAPAEVYISIWGEVAE